MKRQWKVTRPPSATGRRAVQHEKIVQQHIVQLLTPLAMLKANRTPAIWVFGTRRSRGSNCSSCGTFVQADQGMRQTPGWADLAVFLKASQLPGSRPTLLMVEAKHGTNKMSPDQREFKLLCSVANIAHVDGDLDAVIRWLLIHEYLSAGQVPHYRLPAGTVV